MKMFSGAQTHFLYMYRSTSRTGAVQATKASKQSRKAVRRGQHEAGEDDDDAALPSFSTAAAAAEVEVEVEVEVVVVAVEALLQKSAVSACHSMSNAIGKPANAQKGQQDSKIAAATAKMTSVLRPSIQDEWASR
jgi:hypothetical protein